MSTVSQAGAWTWFGDPRAIEVDGVTYLGFSTPEGIWVGRYDGSTWATHKLVSGGENDHDVASVATLPDGRVLACYSPHNGAMRSAISTIPGSIAAWSDPVEIDAGACTYPNLHRLGSTWYLFYRRLDGAGTFPQYYVTSTDGVSWSAPTKLFEVVGQRPYFKVDGNGARLDFLTTKGHPNNVDPTENGIWHFTFDGTTWATSAGVDMGLPPFDTTDATLVHLGTDNAWTWDIATAGSNPVAVYATFPGFDPNLGINEHAYHYARWDGATWQTREITAAGSTIVTSGTEPYYSGGVVLDHASPSTVYLSRQVGTGWQVQRWTTPDHGTAWGIDLLSGIDTKNIRPVAVRGSARVVWMAGRYDDYDDYDTVLLAEPPLTLPDPEEPETAPVAPATATAFIEWIACDLVSGDKIAYLPGITGTVSRALGAYASDTLTLPAPLAGRLALGGLLNQAVGPDQLPTRMVVCIVNDVPGWAGIIWKVRGGTAATIELGCATPESYFDRRYVGDAEFIQVDQALIAAALAEETNLEGINLLIDAPELGVPRERRYWDDEDATYYQRLQELMEVDGGPEWTITPEWRTARQQSVKLRFPVRSRIGSAIPRGPVSTRGAAAATYTATYDYGKGAGANDVLAYSSGEGEDRPQSVHVRNELAIARGVPRVEHRWSPSSSIKNRTVLNQHAAAELRRIDGGTTSIEVNARWNIAPVRLGIDISLGDAVDYDLVGHMHPLGLVGTGRLVGYRLNTTTGRAQLVLRKGA